MSTSVLENASLYVDIDALFDMRVAVLRHFGTDALEKAVATGYYTRMCDEFEGVDTSVYQHRYIERDKQDLAQAMITPVAKYIHLFAKQTLMAYINSPYRRQPQVMVNTYPYHLTEEETSVLIAGLRAVTSEIIDIAVVRLSLAELTPSYVKKHYISMVMYAYWDWLELHSLNQSLAESRCQSVSLIGPRLVKSKEAVRELSNVDVFTAIETYTGLFIKLQLYPVNVFCVDIDRLAKTQQAAAPK